MDKQLLLTLQGKGQPATMEMGYKIEQHLYKEARTLNEEKMADWFETLADDLVYWAPLRENRLRKNLRKKPEFSIYCNALFDETKDSIAMRLKRVDSGMCWTDDPPTRQVYAVSNVEAYHTDVANEYEVHSVFTLYRSRFERDDSTLMGRRVDVLRNENDRLLLAGRLILLQQSTLLAKNLSSFF